VTYRARCEGRRRRYKFEKEVHLPEGAELTPEWARHLNWMSRPRRKGPTWDVRAMLAPGFYTLSHPIEFTGGVLIAIIGAAPYRPSWEALPPSDYEGTVILLTGGSIAVLRRSTLRIESIGLVEDTGIPLTRPVGAWFRAREAACILGKEAAT
jgi:hypothetical protein